MTRRDFSREGEVGQQGEGAGGKELKLLLNLNASLDCAALFVCLPIC